MVLQTSGQGLSASEALEGLDGLSGLTASQAAQRLRDDGPNALPGDQRRNLRAIARETLQEPMFMLLLAAP